MSGRRRRRHAECGGTGPAWSAREVAGAGIGRGGLRGGVDGGETRHPRHRPPRGVPSRRLQFVLGPRRDHLPKLPAPPRRNRRPDDDVGRHAPLPRRRHPRGVGVPPASRSRGGLGRGEVHPRRRPPPRKEREAGISLPDDGNHVERGRGVEIGRGGAVAHSTIAVGEEGRRGGRGAGVRGSLRSDGGGGCAESLFGGIPRRPANHPPRGLHRQGHHHAHHPRRGRPPPHRIRRRFRRGRSPL
mmetsp:Transcript_1870/g.3854  ORF Transcript_1870/g.3854 Transcript_1870/m.3854 type:complete len:243 (-) Transcript_1870:686-1414(-)